MRLTERARVSDATRGAAARVESVSDRARAGVAETLAKAADRMDHDVATAVTHRSRSRTRMLVAAGALGVTAVVVWRWWSAPASEGDASGATGAPETVAQPPETSAPRAS